MDGWLLVMLLIGVPVAIAYALGRSVRSSAGGLAVVLGLPAVIIVITGLLYRAGASSDDAETRAWAEPWRSVIYLALASAVLGLLAWLFGRAHRQRDEVRSARGAIDPRPPTGASGSPISARTRVEH